MSSDEMRTLLTEILDAQYRFLQQQQDPAPRASLSDAASPEQLLQLEKVLEERGISMPPSYRQFLNISNGISNFRIQTRFKLRSISELIESEEEDEGWDDLADDFDDVGTVHQFIVGEGDVTVVCGFDPESVDEHGEMKFIEFYIDAEDPHEHDSFEAFLRTELKNYQDDIAMNEQGAHRGLIVQEYDPK